jgi:HEAT repeat protein
MIQVRQRETVPVDEDEARDTLDRFEANLFHDLYRSRWNGEYAAEIVPPLRQCLTSREVGTLLRSLSALHRIGPEAHQAEADVLPLLNNQESKVREAAVWALSGICLRQPDGVIPRLIEAANDPELLRPVMFALIGFGEKAVSSTPLFLRAFESPDSRQRLLAVRGLKEIGSTFPEIEGVIRRGIVDRSKEVRRYVEKLLKSKWPDRYLSVASENA